jgi:hypothetical protein
MFKGLILKARPPVYIINESYSVYKGVLVVWDSDYDSRVLDFIDDLDSETREKLISVGERKGSIHFLWAETIPDQFLDGCRVDVGGDSWSIVSSECVKSK